MKKSRIDEATLRVYRSLLERFGEPIGQAPSTVGVPDERQDESTMCQSCGGSHREDENCDDENLYVEGMLVAGDFRAGDMVTMYGINEKGKVTRVDRNVISVMWPGASVAQEHFPDELEIVDMMGEAKKGPSKKQAKSWIEGTKKFSDKVDKAKKMGMKSPSGFAAWMQHKATGEWPSES